MNRKLTRCLETAGVRLGIDALFYRVNCSAKRVVTFHNVIPDEILRHEDRGGICFSASAFRRAVRELKRHFRFSTDFADEGALTVTFDDGYLNQYETAGAVLSEENVPAVLFVSGALIGSMGFGRALAVDRILQWQVDVPIKIAEDFFGRTFKSRGELWSSAVLPFFAGDAECLGERAWERLRTVYDPAENLKSRDPEYVRLRFDGVTTDQIAELRSRGWKVGYHTRSHFPLSRLSGELAREELTPPDPEMLKVPFAYPYGNEDFVSERDERIVADLGYPCAYSCQFDPSARQGRFFLPRMMPPIDIARLHFELSGFRHFLRYGKSLPGVPFGE